MQVYCHEQGKRKTLSSQSTHNMMSYIEKTQIDLIPQQIYMQL